MKTVCKLNMCAGCMACLEVCAKNAITIEDTFKAYNAVIDTNSCVECGRCHSVCQSNTVIKLEQPIMWKQGWARDETVREQGASGGVASAIALAFLQQGGVVCACSFGSGEFGFDFACSKEQAGMFSGSKYVKSNPMGVYGKIKRLLSEGKKVLFIGLPCQVAAVKIFVGDKTYDNLYTIDLVCHGTPSPRILNRFLEEYHINLEDIDEISFRKKHVFGIYKGEKRLENDRVWDFYTYAFLQGVDYTDNCYSCKYATIHRVGDLTLGDSWGTELEIEEQRKGISLILCQNDRGKRLLTSTQLVLKDVELERAIEFNKQLRAPSEISPKRKKFMALLENGSGINAASEKCFPIVYLKQRIKKILLKLF